MGLICTPYGYSGAGKVSGISYQGTILGDKPVAYWSLNETSGTVAHDLSGNGFNMAYQNAPTLGAAAIAPGLGKSVSLNGSSQYVELAAPPSALQLVKGSFEIWCNQSTVVKGAALFSNAYASTVVNFAILQGSAKNANPTTALLAGANFDNAFNLVGYTTTLSSNTPYHVVYTNNGTNAYLYVNGQLLASGSVASFTPNSGAIYIGSNWGLNYFVKGLLSNAAIYNTVLSATQILNHYNAGIA